MNKIKNTSMFLLWSGAAISIAEIYTGCLAAPLGFIKGTLAILIGHLIGGALLAMGGLISFNDKRNAMEKVKDALGEYGVKIVAFLNVLQLLGWSAVMIIQGARGINSTLKISYSICLVLMTLLVFIWSYYFENKSKFINDLAVLILFILVAMMFVKVDLGSIISSKDSISFTTAIELSIAMPVSWLPLIGDYAMKGESKKGVLLSSFFGYFIASCGMFILGLAITLFTGMDIIEFISSFSIPVVACVIIVLSTVTTTFLDIFSAVESSKQIFNIKNESRMIAIYCVVSFIITLVFPIENYEGFLLTIGSVFVPVYSVVILEYFLNPGKLVSKINTPAITFVAIGYLLFSYFTKNNVFIPTVCILTIISLGYIVMIRLRRFNLNNKTTGSDKYEG